MKKFIALVAMVTAAVTLSTSCEGVKTTTEYFADLVSLVDGTPESGNFYVIFDNKQTAYVTNTSNWAIPSSAYTDGEARAVIQYSIDGEKSGFDKSIKVVEIFPIATNPVYIKTEKPLDFNSMLSTFNVKKAYMARNYINLGLQYTYSDNPTTHEFYLIYNPDHDIDDDNPFKVNYMDDGYLHLELYRDPGRETGIEMYDTYISFKFDPKALYIDNIDDYLGIKILYRSHENKDQTGEYIINFE